MQKKAYMVSMTPLKECCLGFLARMPRFTNIVSKLTNTLLRER